ncbi:MAG: hypothetical protein WA130_20385 [Candidatus Methanoperedens sp.]
MIGIEQDFYGVAFLTTLESVLSKDDEKEITEESREKQLKVEDSWTLGCCSNLNKGCLQP